MPNTGWMAYDFYVYVLASKSGVLYVGMTNNLEFRVWQHKTKQEQGFTARYNVDRLVWFEHHTYVNNAIAREKQIKGWKRSRKVDLIGEENPGWLDLAEGWTTYDQIAREGGVEALRFAVEDDEGT